MGGRTVALWDIPRPRHVQRLDAGPKCPAWLPPGGKGSIGGAGPAGIGNPAYGKRLADASELGP